MYRAPTTALLIPLALLACQEPVEAEDVPSVILDVTQGATQTLPGLSAPVEVLYNAYDVPTIFGENDADVARVHGYLIARDRFFFLDLSRRLGLGEVSALVGIDGLSTDIESRQRGVTTAADLMADELTRAPAQAAYIEAYAEGINAYLDQVRAGDLEPPAEIVLLAPFLDIDPVDSLEDFDSRDVVAGMAYIVFETAWEPGDVSRARDAARLPDLFEGAALESLRKAGLGPDVFDRVIPAVSVGSAPDWVAGEPSPYEGASASPGATPGPAPRPPLDMLDRLEERLHSAATRLGKDRDAGFGSNSWAVSGKHTASGHALLAADPHLPLSIPSLMWQVGLNTQELGGGDLHVVGHQITPFLYMASGTNGDFAWGQTNSGGGDITDWYAERITLDANGAPATSLFQGEQKPLVVTIDTYEIATVPALGSAGGVEQIARYATFDGRWINSIEGRKVDGPGDAKPGETAVNMMGTWIIPEDTDGVDGITAVSFDYAGFDMRAMVRAGDRITRAKDLEDFVEISKDFVAYGLQIVAADNTGSILYTPYMAMPCRSYLPRNPDGSFIQGADPRMLIDGTRYGGFEIPADADGHVDFSKRDDPSRCLVPWEDHPWSVDPEQGFLHSANGDPGGMSFDNSVTNDGSYIGGPWSDGFRMGEISEELKALVARGKVTVEDMRVLQSDHHSTIGKWLVPVLLDALDAAAAAAKSPTAPTDEAELRIAALYDAHAARFDEVSRRLQDWATRGYSAESGVDTFYDGPADADRRADAVATMIFNAWMGRYVQKAVEDEGMPTGSTGSFGVLRMMLESRDTPSAARSYNPATGESAYWDILGTEVIESSDEVAILALVDAIAFLEGPYLGKGQGGFGTPDADQWLWGLRHWVQMEPLLLELLGKDLAFLVADFAITTSTFPMADDLAPGDPRADIPGFPRHSDHRNVDAGNSGTSGTRFNTAYGPTARMAVELRPDGAVGINVIPGGQTSNPASDHFADQARLWLGNEAMAIGTRPADIVASSVRRDTFKP